MNTRQAWISSHAFLLTALAAAAVSAPVFAEEAAPLPRQELMEEIIVTARRIQAPRETPRHEESKLVLEVLRANREREAANAERERTGRSRIRLGYEPDEDTGPLIDSRRQQVALSMVRPADVIRIGF